jgi:hypothetical protein
MHIKDIEVFAMRTGLDGQFAGRNAKVIVVLPKDGKKFYVGLRGVTPNRDDAFVYDYDQHKVADQCEQVFLQMGVKPEVVEV